MFLLSHHVFFFFFNSIFQISEKNDQIEKLINRVKVLHSLNNEFANDHKKLQRKLIALQEKCNDLCEQEEKGCESCRQLIDKEDKLQSTNKQLLNDVTMMKTLIYRLNVQLEKYQEKLRKKSFDSNEPIRDTSTSSYHSQNSHSASIESTHHWGTINSHALAPLLNAYEETINDKNDLIQQHEIEIDRIGGRLKDILQENEQLHSRLNEFSRLNENYVIEKTKLNAQLDVCR